MAEANNFQKMYRQLNPEQAQAVDAIEGPVMVLAGPGTGKTQVLAMRIANILQKTQMDPWNILCLTFTESGVAAMRERLLQIIGTPAYYVRIHTFHSFCNDVITQHPEIFAKRALRQAQGKQDWQALTDVERVALMRDLIDRLPGTSPIKPFGSPYLFLRDMAGNIQALKQEDISPEDFREVLASIERFLTAVREDLAVFYALKPKERTESACEQVQEKLTAAAQAAQLPWSLRQMAERVGQRFRTHTAAAESEPFDAAHSSTSSEFRSAQGKRAASKVRTAYKNEVKKWVDGLERSLPKQQDMAQVYAWYVQELTERGRYDYEDMIIMVLEEWRKNDVLLAEAQEQFQYILADEYQDTNGAQNEVLMMLGSWDTQPNLFVVGDDKQSIYRFQGASLQNMLDFYERYREAVKVVALKQNYRSQEVVLRAAGSVIAHNKESVVKYIPDVSQELKAAAGRPAQPVEYVNLSSEGAEDVFVVQRIQELLKAGAEPEEIAVLFRYHRDGSELLRLLALSEVPARLEAGEDALNDVMVRQLVLLLQYIAHPRREDLLAEVLQFSWWKFSDLDVLKVLYAAGRRGTSLFSVLVDEEGLRAAGVAEPQLFTEWIDELAAWRRAADNVMLQELLHRILTESGLLDHVLHGAEAIEALQKLSRLLEEAKNLNLAQREMTLKPFMDHVQLLQEHGVALTTQPWQVSGKAVRLMTAHKAKGLEFEHVIITRMNDKHWGNNPDPGRLNLPQGLVRFDMVVANENNEDERRLFYVAMTRAKQSLTLTRSHHTASGRPAVPSLFVSEMAADDMEVRNLEEGPEESQERLARGIQPLPDQNGKRVREWLTSLLPNYVMSVTHLNNYLECPYKFYVNNLLHVPSIRTPYQALGTAVHETLQDVALALTAGKELPKTEEVVRWFERYLEREVLAKQDWEDVRAVGRKVMRDYFEYWKGEMRPTVLPEYDFRGHGVQIDGLMLTGKIDKVELLDEADVGPDGAWRKGARVKVVDYKTGDAEKGLRALKAGEKYHRQLVFYKLLCDTSPQFPYEMVAGEVDFVQPSERKGFIKKTVNVSGEDVAHLQQSVGETWQEIKALRFLEQDAMCGACDICSSKLRVKNVGRASSAA